MPVTTLYNKRPSFRSMSCDYKLNGQEMGLYTWMFRDDVNWRKLALLESVNFSNKDKVNIIQFAPSDGSEGYTQILSLLLHSPEDAEKFLPIQAYDINPDIVNSANKGYLNLNIGDIERLAKNGVNVEKCFPGSLQYYIENKNSEKLIFKTFKVAEELTKKIKFNQGDMFKILPQIKDDSNTVIFARNSIGYYDEKTREAFISKASKVLKAGSLFIIGLLEEEWGLEYVMRRYGFKKVIRNVFRKGAL